MSVSSRLREAAKSPTRRTAEEDRALDVLAKPILVTPSLAPSRRLISSQRKAAARRAGRPSRLPATKTGLWQVTFVGGGAKTFTDKGKAKKVARTNELNELNRIDKGKLVPVKF